MRCVAIRLEASLYEPDDVPITSSLSASDAAGNQFSPIGNPVTLDRDSTEKPIVMVNNGSATAIGLAGAAAVPFAVSGLSVDDNGTLTFSDGSKAVTVTITGGAAVAGAHNTTTTVDLSGLADDVPITSSLSASDAAGNPFSPNGNPVTLDRDVGEQVALRGRIA
jgi:hypothetical protein